MVKTNCTKQHLNANLTSHWSGKNFDCTPFYVKQIERKKYFCKSRLNDRHHKLMLAFLAFPPPKKKGDSYPTNLFFF